MPTNKQQREAARRHLQRQLEARREAEARRRKTLIVVTVVATLVVIGVVVALTIGLSGGSSKPSAAAASPSTSASGTASATTPAAAATTGPCAYKPAAAGNANLKDVGLPPDPDPAPTATRTMTFTTNLGPIVMTLDGAGAPCNVQALSYLAQKGFYDGTSCHRVVNSGIFVLQCGDPSGTGSGGPTFTTKDENLSAATYTAGTVAMANGGANTNSSQFFFIGQDSSSGLQKSYTVVGHITQGLDIVQKVITDGSDNSNGQGDGKPKDPVSFTTVTVDPPLDLSAASSSPAAGGSAAVSPPATGDTASAPIASTSP